MNMRQVDTAVLRILTPMVGTLATLKILKWQFYFPWL